MRFRAIIIVDKLVIAFSLDVEGARTLTTTAAIYRQSPVASLVHALVILPMTACCLHLPALAADRAFGIRAPARSLLSRVGKNRTSWMSFFFMTHGTYTPYLFFGRYFLWDAIVSLVHYEGIDLSFMVRVDVAQLL